MRLYALIGRSLSHSFSARYFGEKFKRETIDAEYHLVELDDVVRVRQFIAEHPSLCGFNVTIPYKQEIIPLLNDIDATAREVGAVNCVSVVNGYTKGYNTDIEGIASSLNLLNVESTIRAIVLGSGGAAQAVCHTLRSRGIGHIVVSRQANRGDYTYDTLTADIIDSHKLIINTTPLGMFPHTECAPSIDYSAIGRQHKIFDLVYNPATTRFMTLCASQGATVIGGSHMLQVQAEASWRIWESAR